MKKRTYYGKPCDEDTVALVKSLRKHGFQNYDEVLSLHPKFQFNCDGSGGGAYIGPKFVVKDSNICGNMPPRHLTCPTTILKNGWMIQPKCRVFVTLSERTKMKYIKAGHVTVCEYGYHYLTNGGEDAHDENFGVYKGKLRQFDW